jgi:hypothetical protein
MEIKWGKRESEARHSILKLVIREGLMGCQSVLLSSAPGTYHMHEAVGVEPVLEGSGRMASAVTCYVEALLQTIIDPLFYPVPGCRYRPGAAFKRNKVPGSAALFLFLPPLLYRFFRWLTLPVADELPPPLRRHLPQRWRQGL